MDEGLKVVLFLRMEETVWLILFFQYILGFNGVTGGSVQDFLTTKNTTFFNHEIHEKHENPLNARRTLNARRAG